MAIMNFKISMLALHLKRDRKIALCVLLIEPIECFYLGQLGEYQPRP